RLFESDIVFDPAPLIDARHPCGSHTASILRGPMDDECEHAAATLVVLDGAFPEHEKLAGLKRDIDCEIPVCIDTPPNSKVRVDAAVVGPDLLSDLEAAVTAAL